jgi:glycosyltransferase involved in cell wall biosynthesis
MKQRKYTKGVKKKYGIKGKVILHTGRITKEKSIDSILNMITPLLKNATFVIASDGPYREKLEEIVQKKGFADSVKFTGYLSEEDLIGFYKEADVFVMASKTETQGLVLLEAAFYGLPSVVMEAPVIADFVRSNKIGTVSKKKSFATIVKKYLNKRQRVSKSNIKQYDIQKCAKQMEELYQNLVQSQ